MSEERGVSQLADRGEGRCGLSGPLTLETAPWLWKELQTTGLLSRAREADLAGIASSDSAGLALLLAWKAECRRSGNGLGFRGAPDRLRALAALTGAEGLLGMPA